MTPLSQKENQVEIEIKPVGLKNKATLIVRENLRPRTCPDLDCKPLVRGWSSSQEDLDRGFSGMCYGYCGLKEWNFKEAQHPNDICVCVMTPFKGHIKFVQNFNDLANTFYDTKKMIQMLSPVHCKNCGVGRDDQPISFYGNGKDTGYCRACAVLLGFVIYNKETKEYTTNWDKIKESKT